MITLFVCTRRTSIFQATLALIPEDSQAPGGYFPLLGGVSVSPVSQKAIIEQSNISNIIYNAHGTSCWTWGRPRRGRRPRKARCRRESGIRRPARSRPTRPRGCWVFGRLLRKRRIVRLCTQGHGHFGRGSLFDLTSRCAFIQSLSTSNMNTERGTRLFPMLH